MSAAIIKSHVEPKNVHKDVIRPSTRGQEPHMRNHHWGNLSSGSCTSAGFAKHFWVLGNVDLFL